MKKFYLLTICITLFGNSVLKSQCTVDFASSNDLCTGLPVTVNFTYSGTNNNNGCLNFSWNFGAGSTPSTSTAQNPTTNYSSAGAKNVTLTVTNQGGVGCGGACGGGGGTSVTKIINITPKPNVSFSSTAPQCVNSPVNFTNTATNTGQDSLTYNWDFGADATPRTSTADNPTGIVYSSSGTKSVQFQITNSIGCVNTVTQNIIINATPTVSFASTSPQCTGLPVDFTNTGTSVGVTYLWDFGSEAAPATSPLQNPTGVVYSTAGSKIITLTTTNSTTGGCAITLQQTININQTPTASFSSTAPVCVNKGVDFTHTLATLGNWSYSWDFGLDATPRTSTSENPVGISFGSGGTKTVTFTVYNTFCTKTLTQNISIYALPIANAGKDTIICPNTSVQIGSVSIVGNTYSWFPTSTLNDGNISNPISTSVAPNTQYLVTVTAAGLGNCVNTDTIIVTMLAPLVANAGVDGVICRYDSIQVGAGLVKGQQYLWSPSAGLSSTTLSNPVSSPDSTTVYQVTVTDAYLTNGVSCPSVTDEVTIIVRQLPIAEAGPDNTITVGTNLKLTATGGLQYTWSPAYGLDNIGINTPIANPEYTTLYMVQVIDIYGCVKEDSLTITVIPPTVWVPTAFTPNGDGKSDIFIVRGEGITKFEFGVFNSWGEQIFYSKDMNIGWDGTRAVTGEEQPANAYVYYVRGIKSNGEVVDLKGMVTLIR